MLRNLRRVYWETTAACNLRCLHCRRLDVLEKGSPEELATEQAKNLIDELACIKTPVLILSGGEPLIRHDILEIASYGRDKGLHIGLATNGTLLDANLAKRLKEHGIYYGSISLDGAKAETHDFFRGQGNFDKAIRGIEHLKNAGVKVQVNLTVTRQNVGELEETYKLACSLGIFAIYLFLLVPVGCGEQIADSQMLNSQEVEEWLRWVCKKDKEGPIPLKVICAPHYFRIEHQQLSPQSSSLITDRKHQQLSPQSSSLITDRKGCLAGINMCFVSHKGDVFPCGYLPVSCGNITKTPFQKIWENSQVFQNFSDPELLQGKCGQCSFKEVCGGCRARAYFNDRNLLSEEPYCLWEPTKEEAK